MGSEAKRKSLLQPLVPRVKFDVLVTDPARSVLLEHFFDRAGESFRIIIRQRLL